MSGCEQILTYQPEYTIYQPRSASTFEDREKTYMPIVRVKF